MPIVWTCKFNRTWIIKQLLQYKWSNKVTYGIPRKAMVLLRSWMIPGLAWEHSSPWRGPVEKQQQQKQWGFYKLSHLYMDKSYVAVDEIYVSLYCYNVTLWVITQQRTNLCGGRKLPAWFQVNILVKSEIRPTVLICSTGPEQWAWSHSVTQ